MTSHLIQHALDGGYVFGFGVLKTGIETVFGPMAIQPSPRRSTVSTPASYISPLFRRTSVDKVIGQRKSVIIGSVLMACGQFLLMSEVTFLPGLFFLILGNGCFKPNISTQVGSLYAPGDPRRDRAFTIFYMGINLGAFFSPLVCGTLGQVYGWKYGFMAAGIGMIAGLCVYLWGQRFLARDHLSRTRAGEVKHEPLTAKEWKAIGALVVLARSISSSGSVRTAGEYDTAFRRSKHRLDGIRMGYAIHMVPVIQSPVYLCSGAGVQHVLAHGRRKGRRSLPA